MKNFIIIISMLLFVTILSLALKSIYKPSRLVTIHVGNKTFKGVVGRGGIKVAKQEGDGATPAGTFPIHEIFYRPDRINKADIHSLLPIYPLSADDGWADDSASPFYNKHVKLPFAASHEELWRDDDVYDIIVVVGYNDAPVIKQKGSAIFLHIARENYTPTAGCIALSKKDLLQVLSYLTPQSKIKIDSNGNIQFKGVRPL